MSFVPVDAWFGPETDFYLSRVGQELRFHDPADLSLIKTVVLRVGDVRLVDLILGPAPEFQVRRVYLNLFELSTALPSAQPVIIKEVDMGFDNTNPVDLESLQTEIATDPVTQGYDTTFSDTNLNVTRVNADTVTGTTKIQSTGYELLQSINVEATGTEYAAAVNTTEKQMLVNTLCEAIGANTSIDPQDISADIPIEFKDEILAIFNNTDAPTIRQAIIDTSTKPQSRAEELYGEGTVITTEDYILARDYTP